MMLIPQADGTYLAGPLDAMFIWHNMETGRFHPVFFEESPLPGPVKNLEETTVVRLKSKMHHTEGFETLEQAIASAKDLLTKIILDDVCVLLDPPLEWDGHPAGVMVMANWRDRAA